MLFDTAFFRISTHTPRKKQARNILQARFFLHNGFLEGCGELLFRKKFPTSLPTSSPLLLLRFENQAPNQRKQQGSGDPCGSRRQPTGDDPQNPVLLHRRLHALCQQMPKPHQGHGSPCPRILLQGGEHPYGASQYPQANVPRQDPRRGQLGLVDEDLCQKAEHSSHPKRVQVFHHTASKQTA